MKPSAFLTLCVAHKTRDVGIFSVATSGPAGGTAFFARLGSDWMQYSTVVDWPAIAMAVHRYPGTPDVLVLALGAEAKFWEMEPGQMLERIGQIPGDLSGVTNCAVIHDAIWLCGMGRIAWKRDANAQWHDLSAPDAGEDDGVVGFTAMAQANRESLVAVGWGGEVWWRNASGWQQEDSGINANLNAVSVKADGTVIAVGDRGALLEGRRGQWQSYAAAAAFNMQDVCCWNDEVFVCSDFEIFRWHDAALIPETRFANADRPRTCMRLRAGRDVVFSVGEGDVFKFEHGAWTRVA